MEKFMLQHGSKIVDFLGGQIDRIEKDFMVSQMAAVLNDLHLTEICIILNCIAFRIY